MDQSLEEFLSKLTEGLGRSERRRWAGVQFVDVQLDRDSGKTDLTYLIEASSDLVTWTSIARSVAGGPMTNLGGAGTVTETPMSGGILGVTVQDGQSSLNVTGSRFLRLRVIAH